MGLPDKPRQIWLRSFYGFNPEDDGYIGWNDQSARDRMLGMVEDGDIFMIYGAASAETARAERHRVIGFLQVRAEPIRDRDKASAEGMLQKRESGWEEKWTYALPVTRAWRVDEPILLEMIAPHTYRPEAGQAIAAWSPSLNPQEVDLALKIRVREVNVFGEPPVSDDLGKAVLFEEAYKPSRAFPGSFGERTVNYEDGPTRLYLARFDGDGFALLGEKKSQFDKSVLMKIGVSNDVERRTQELNSGFPPAAAGKWAMQLVSQPFEGRRAAETAEQAFKDASTGQLDSLGGEFFRGDWIRAQLIFAKIPGVSRFGR